MKLFLDDVRDFYGEGVVIVRDGETFLDIWMALAYFKMLPEEVHLDHDLGERDKTGMDVLNELEKEAFCPGSPEWFPKIFIHTMNASARPVMQRVADKINQKYHKED